MICPAYKNDPADDEDGANQSCCQSEGDIRDSPCHKNFAIRQSSCDVIGVAIDVIICLNNFCSYIIYKTSTSERLRWVNTPVPARQQRKGKIITSHCCSQTVQHRQIYKIFMRSLLYEECTWQTIDTSTRRVLIPLLMLVTSDILNNLGLVSSSSENTVKKFHPFCTKAEYINDQSSAKVTISKKKRQEMMVVIIFVPWPERTEETTSFC